MDDLCDPYVVRFHPDMTRAHNEGRKCCTTRRHQIGKVGQVFVDENLPGQQFRIIEVRTHTLEHVAGYYYKCEGFASPDAFQDFWEEMHDGEFIAGLYCYTHIYAPVLGDALILNRGNLMREITQATLDAMQMQEANDRTCDACAEALREERADVLEERCRIHRVRYVEDLPVSVLEEMQVEWGRC